MRSRTCIALAKVRGAYRGRKRTLTDEQIIDLRERVAAGEPKARLAREFGISRETVYQYLRRGSAAVVGAEFAAIVVAAGSEIPGLANGDHVHRRVELTVAGAGESMTA